MLTYFLNSVIAITKGTNGSLFAIEFDKLGPKNDSPANREVMHLSELTNDINFDSEDNYLEDLGFKLINFINSNYDNIDKFIEAKINFSNFENHYMMYIKNIDGRIYCEPKLQVS